MSLPFPSTQQKDLFAMTHAYDTAHAQRSPTTISPHALKSSVDPDEHSLNAGRAR